MILYDTDYANIYRQMLAERDKVEYWRQRNKKKVLKLFKQSPTVPVFYHEIRTMPDTNNRYLFWYYAMTKNETEHESCFAGAVLLLNNNKGQRVAITLKTFSDVSIPNRTVDSLQIFSSHFFSRYRERYTYLEPSDSIKLLVQFFGRNGGYMMEVDYNDFVLEKNRKANGSAWGMDDGVTLASKEWIDVDGKRIFITRHHTFLSRNELKPDQQAVLPSQDNMRSRLIHHFND